MNEENEIKDLISRHWNHVKNKVGKDGLKYSDKYPIDVHNEFVRTWIKNLGFEHIKARLEYVIETGKTLHVV